MSGRSGLKEAEPRPRPTTTILEWTPVSKNTLVGFCSVCLPSGMRLHDVAVHRHADGRVWAMPASKLMVDRNGNVLRGEDGKPRYTPIVDFASRALRDRFSDSVIEALRRSHPNALP